MNLLLELDRHFPIAIVGTISGIASWIIGNSEQINSVFGTVGVVCSGTLAFLSMTAWIVARIIRVVRWVRTWRRNRAERLRFRTQPQLDELP